MIIRTLCRVLKTFRRWTSAVQGSIVAQLSKMISGLNGTVKVPLTIAQ
jgi:hypothetical protein